MTFICRIAVEVEENEYCGTGSGQSTGHGSALSKWYGCGTAEQGAKTQTAGMCRGAASATGFAVSLQKSALRRRRWSLPAG